MQFLHKNSLLEGTVLYFVSLKGEDKSRLIPGGLMSGTL